MEPGLSFDFAMPGLWLDRGLPLSLGPCRSSFLSTYDMNASVAVARRKRGVSPRGGRPLGYSTLGYSRSPRRECKRNDPHMQACIR